MTAFGALARSKLPVGPFRFFLPSGSGSGSGSGHHQHHQSQTRLKLSTATSGSSVAVRHPARRCVCSIYPPRALLRQPTPRRLPPPPDHHPQTLLIDTIHSPSPRQHLPLPLPPQTTPCLQAPATAMSALGTLSGGAAGVSGLLRLRRRVAPALAAPSHHAAGTLNCAALPDAAPLVWGRQLRPSLLLPATLLPSSSQAARRHTPRRPAAAAGSAACLLAGTPIPCTSHHLC